MRSLARVPLFALLALAAPLAGLAPPASAANLLLHKRTSSATAVGQIDSTLWTLTTGASAALPARDTLVTSLGTINTDNFPTVLLPDSTSDRGAIGAGKPFPKSLWVVVEVTGALQSIDTLYAYVQYSQGQVPAGTGQTNTYTTASLGDPNSNPANWRWYDGIGLSGSLTGGLTQLVSNTGSNTFIFPISAAASDIKANWMAASNLRVILVSDTNAAAVGLSTRAWLCWR